MNIPEQLSGLDWIKKSSASEQLLKVRMATYSDGPERFVETPDIVDICVISDDPDFFAEPEDLFDKQGEGLPAWWAYEFKDHG